MGRVQVLGVATLWLFVAASAVRSRLRRREDQHWLTALETLRQFGTRPPG